MRVFVVLQGELVEYFYYWKKTPSANSTRPQGRRRRARKQAATPSSRQTSNEDRKLFGRSVTTHTRTPLTSHAPCSPKRERVRFRAKVNYLECCLCFKTQGKYCDKIVYRAHYLLLLLLLLQSLTNSCWFG